MLIAIDQEGRRVNLFGGLPEAQDFFCPACGGRVILKKGRVKRPHFAHKTLTAYCQAMAEAEGPEHLSLKEALYHWSRGQLEAYLPEIQQTADLLIGDCLALEIQCSSLSIKRLMERTLAYRQLGYPVFWLLGERLWLTDKLTRLQEQFLYYSQQRGFFCWELDLGRTCLRLKSLIHLDLQGRIYHLTEEFPFGEGDLLEILRIPYQKQKMKKLPMPRITGQKHYLARELYYRSRGWMEVQETYYMQGRQLLNEDFSKSYIAPPGLNLLDLEPGQADFLQVDEDLSDYYQNFSDFFHQDKKADFLYPPAFYAIMEDKLRREKDAVCQRPEKKSLKP